MVCEGLLSYRTRAMRTHQPVVVPEVLVHEVGVQDLVHSLHSLHTVSEEVMEL